MRTTENDVEQNRSMNETQIRLAEMFRVSQGSYFACTETQKLKHKMTEEEQLRNTYRVLATGMEEREVARAYYYAKEYGLDALDPEVPELCSVFKEPTCGSWNCVNPEHQVLKFEKPED
jgi:hypothetical protein